MPRLHASISCSCWAGALVLVLCCFGKANAKESMAVQNRTVICMVEEGPLNELNDAKNEKKVRC